MAGPAVLLYRPSSWLGDLGNACRRDVEFFAPQEILHSCNALLIAAFVALHGSVHALVVSRAISVLAATCAVPIVVGKKLAATRFEARRAFGENGRAHDRYWHTDKARD